MTALDQLIASMQRGRKNRGGRRKARFQPIPPRERALRRAWYRGQINAARGWKRRPPSRWIAARDVEMQAIFYQAYDAMTRQRSRGRGRMTRPPPHALLATDPAADQSDRRQPSIGA